MENQRRNCHQDHAIHQSRKCNIKIENVIKVENAPSMLSLSAKKNKKGQNTEVMKFNSRQFIHYLTIENAALTWMI